MQVQEGLRGETVITVPAPPRGINLRRKPGGFAAISTMSALGIVYWTFWFLFYPDDRHRSIFMGSFLLIVVALSGWLMWRLLNLPGHRLTVDSEKLTITPVPHFAGMRGERHVPLGQVRDLLLIDDGRESLRLALLDTKDHLRPLMVLSYVQCREHAGDWLVALQHMRAALALPTASPPTQEKSVSDRASAPNKDDGWIKWALLYMLFAGLAVTSFALFAGVEAIQPLQVTGWIVMGIAFAGFALLAVWGWLNRPSVADGIVRFGGELLDPRDVADVRPVRAAWEVEPDRQPKKWPRDLLVCLGGHRVGEATLVLRQGVARERHDPELVRSAECLKRALGVTAKGTSAA